MTKEIEDKALKQLDEVRQLLETDGLMITGFGVHASGRVWYEVAEKIERG